MRTLSPLRKRPLVLGALCVGALALGGTALYGENDALADAGQAAPAAPSVDVISTQTQPIRIWSSFSGRLAAVEHVDVRPRVSGTITEILFEDGQVVQAGDALFVIDPRPYEAALSTAKAALTSATSQKELAYSELQRAKKLAKNKHVSASVVDARHRDYQVSLAAIDAAQAQVITAELDLEYAHIAAPVTGRISRAEITVGNVIEAGANAPILTTIVSSDHLYAEFDVDEQTYIRSVRGMREEKMPVELRLNGAKDVVYHGEVDSFDNRLDVSSGTIRARALFSNADGALLPGMYADVRMGSAGKESMILVPERAIGTDQNKRYVYVVDAENKVAYREVNLGKTIAEKREILSGLKAGELVMVNSLQRVRPGMHVTPKELTASPEPKDT